MNGASKGATQTAGHPWLLAAGMFWLLAWACGTTESAATSIAMRMGPAIQAVAERAGQEGLLVLMLVAEGSESERWGVPGLVYDESVRLLQESGARVLVSPKLAALAEAGEIGSPVDDAGRARIHGLARFRFLLVETYRRRGARRDVGLILYDAKDREVSNGGVVLGEDDVEPRKNIPQLNRQVLEYCTSRLGQQVGDGECWALAASACRESGAHLSGVYSFGRKLGRWDTPIPGDIVQLDQVVFAGRADSLAARHTAVVEDVQASGVVEVVQQNVPPAGKRVSRGRLRLHDKVGGVLEFYRPRRKVQKAMEPAPADLLKGVPAAVEVPLRGGVKLALRPIPAGRFLMGAPEQVRIPLVPVTLSRPFHIGVTEVTQGQWAAVMGGYPSEARGDQLPVTNVSWDDAQKFLARLNRLPIGRRFRFRLPSEAEWEYACRAGAAGRFSFGEDELDLPERAWFADTAEGRAHQVGQLRPNRWGLYDMHGNVWELTGDFYAPRPVDNPPVPQTDPSGPDDGDARVIRGGAFDSPADICSCGERAHITPAWRTRLTGFRVVAVAQ